ncbi:MAG: hypothetical protein JNL90_17575 [Planctomycetes bacterium]|nr:hypothetical protein [Planctomycetota bacterium]
MIDCRRLFSDRRALPCLLAAAALTVVGMVLTRSAEEAEAAAGATPRRPGATLAANGSDAKPATFRLDSNWRLSAASWEIEEDEPVADSGRAVERDPLAAALAGLDVAVLR